MCTIGNVEGLAATSINRIGCAGAEICILTKEDVGCTPGVVILVQRACFKPVLVGINLFSSIGRNGEPCAVVVIILGVFVD